MQRQPFGQVDERQTKTRQDIKQTNRKQPPSYIVINVSNSNININPPPPHSIIIIIINNGNSNSTRYAMLIEAKRVM